MEEQAQESRVREATKGNVRITLHRYNTTDGATLYAVDMAAYSGWAGQWKLIGLVGGINRRDATGLFRSLARDVRGYDWHEESLVLEKE